MGSDFLYPTAFMPVVLWSDGATALGLIVALAQFWQVPVWLSLSEGNRSSRGRSRSAWQARLERHLGPHCECIELRTRIAEIGRAHLPGNVAAKIVEHEADVAVDVPVQRQRIDGLSPAGDAVHE